MNGANNASGRFERDDIEPDAGANLRFGFPQVSLDATVNPDFSQVESDVGLVTVNERFSLFVPEKRPFFLEGIELFSTPNQLIYTRQIVEPLGGVKLTGKLGRYSVAYLSAVDEVRGPDALFNVTRVRADFGGNSLVGASVTDRRRTGAYNTVAAADVRYVFGRLYYFEGQAGGSWTRDSGAVDSRPASLWHAELDRTGRSWGFNYALNGLEDDFESHAGFVPRSGIVAGHFFNRFSLYGGRGALVENFTFFGGPSRTWEYRAFPDRSPIEGGEQLGGFTIFRGGWRVNWGVFRQLVIFDRALFAGLQTLTAQTFAPYDAPRELSNLWGDSVSVSTPVFSKWQGTLGAAWYATPIFFEGSEGDAARFTAALNVRPTPNIRIEALAVALRIDRDRDGSEFARTIIPRLKVEYQPRRALFFRAVGEWRDERRDVRRDARSGAPLYFNNEPISATEDKILRADWLISYEPTPGTVAFFGYGSTLEAPEGASWSRVRRSADGFFVKLAYQFRR
jgi:hypothetical protein